MLLLNSCIAIFFTYLRIPKVSLDALNYKWWEHAHANTLCGVYLCKVLVLNISSRNPKLKCTCGIIAWEGFIRSHFPKMIRKQYAIRRSLTTEKGRWAGTIYARIELNSTDLPMIGFGANWYDNGGKCAGAQLPLITFRRTFFKRHHYGNIITEFKTLLRNLCNQETRHNSLRILAP